MHKIERGMRELKYEKSTDTMKLMEDLYEAIPEIRPVFFENKKPKVHLRVFTKGNSLTIWINRKIEKERVDEVVEKHKAGED